MPIPIGIMSDSLSGWSWNANLLTEHVHLVKRSGLSITESGVLNFGPVFDLPGPPYKDEVPPPGTLSKGLEHSWQPEEIMKSLTGIHEAPTTVSTQSLESDTQFDRQIFGDIRDELEKPTKPRMRGRRRRRRRKKNHRHQRWRNQNRRHSHGSFQGNPWRRTQSNERLRLAVVAFLTKIRKLYDSIGNAISRSAQDPASDRVAAVVNTLTNQLGLTSDDDQQNQNPYLAHQNQNQGGMMMMVNDGQGNGDAASNSFLGLDLSPVTDILAPLQGDQSLSRQDFILELTSWFRRSVWFILYTGAYTVSPALVLLAILFSLLFELVINFSDVKMTLTDFMTETMAKLANFRKQMSDHESFFEEDNFSKYNVKAASQPYFPHNRGLNLGSLQGPLKL